MSIGQELLNVPMGDMIRQMALSIAQAQFELDKSSIFVAEMMGGQRLLRDEQGRLVDYDGEVISAQTDSDGTPVYDEDGNLKYDEGRGPRIIDSRVHFGYTYEPLMDEDGKPQTWGSDGRVKMVRKPKLVSMLELGFTPTFYQFVDTIIEVKIAIKMTRETEFSSTSKTTSTTSLRKDIVEPVMTFGMRIGDMSMATYRSQKTGTIDQVVSTSVDASYASKYSYSAEGASLLRTKLVPVPPPTILEERIREVMESEREYLRQAAAGAMGVVEKDADKNDLITRTPSGK